MKEGPRELTVGHKGKIKEKTEGRAGQEDPSVSEAGPCRRLLKMGNLLSGPR